MSELGLVPTENRVYFGQLLGMCDQISFPLGKETHKHTTLQRLVINSKSNVDISTPDAFSCTRVPQAPRTARSARVEVSLCDMNRVASALNC